MIKFIILYASIFINFVGSTLSSIIENMKKSQSEQGPRPKRDNTYAGSGSSSGTPTIPPVIKRKASFSASSLGRQQITEIAPAQPAKPDKFIPKKVFKKSFCGDIFGTSGGDSSMLGMLYRSRTRHHGAPIIQRTDSLDDIDEIETEVAELLINDNGDSSGDEQNDPVELNPRQNLARTISNWSFMETNDHHVIREGGVHALIALAGFEDPHVKKWVSSALFNLSSRDANRLELINVGATTGVVTIAMNSRACTWKMARFCAMTLCNLSIAHGGESNMARCGAVSALYNLISLRQHRLLPMSVQGLYNLTCVQHHYPALERIIKALLTLPVATGFDAFPLQIKALVNCTRYAMMRERLIEDGVLAVVSTLTNSLPTRQNKTEIVFYLSTVLRALSETKACLSDLISKGTMEILQQMLPYCDEDSTLLIIKTLRNLLKIIHSFPFAIYATAVNVATEIVNSSDDMIALQYCSSCIHIFTMDSLRRDHKLANQVIAVLPKLLKSTDSLTQFFCVSATGNMFFSGSSDDTEKLEVLVLEFIDAGQGLTDLLAVQEFCIAFAKLSQEPRYINILSQHQRLLPIVKLLLKTLDSYMFNWIIQESCCIAICRFCLKIDAEDIRSCTGDITSLLYRLMEFPMLAMKYNEPKETKNISPIKKLQQKAQSVANLRLSSGASLKKISSAATAAAEVEAKRKCQEGYVSVLAAGMSTIVAFSERNIVCHDELLCKPAFLTKMVAIALRNKDHHCITRYCCATVAIYSHDPHSHAELASPKVLEDLFKLSRLDDVTIRELVATVFCNISTDTEARLQMIECNVMQYLTLLSGTTNELLQELCARCICNLSCSLDQHKKLIENDILQTLLMISLVRSVSHRTKQLAARAMLNMVARESNITEIIDAGVIRAFGTLAAVNDPKTRSICAKGFLYFSSIEQGRAELALRRNALQALFCLLKSGKQSKMVVVVGKAVCNLLASNTTRRAAINAGALPVLKILATSECDELLEATARVIVILSDDTSLHEMLKTEPLVSVLVYILEKSQGWVLECVTHAFTNLARHKVFRTSLIEKGCIPAIVHALIEGKITTMIVAEEICRCLCLLSYESSKVEVMITHGHILVVLYSLYKGKLCNPFCAHMMVIILRNLSYGTIGDENKKIAGVETGVASAAQVPPSPGFIEIEEPEARSNKALQVITDMSNDEPSKSAVTACTCIVQQEGFRLLGWLLYDYGRENPQLLKSVCVTLHNVCQVRTLHEQLVEQGFAAVAFKVAVDHSDAFGDCSNDEDSVASNSNYGEVPRLSKFDVFHLTNAIRLISQTSSVRLKLVTSKIIKVLSSLLTDLPELSRHQIVSSLTQLASSKECRPALVEAKTIDLIIRLSHHAETSETQEQCSSALSSLSEHASVSHGAMESMLVLSLRLDGNAAQRRKTAFENGGGNSNNHSRSHSPALLREDSMAHHHSKKADDLNGGLSPTFRKGTANMSAGVTFPTLSADPLPVDFDVTSNQLAHEGTHASGHTLRKVILDGIERTSECKPVDHNTQATPSRTTFVGPSTETRTHGIAEPRHLREFKAEIDRYATGASILSTTAYSMAAHSEMERISNSRAGSHMLSHEEKPISFQEEAEQLANIPQSMLSSEMAMLTQLHRPSKISKEHPKTIVYVYVIHHFSVHVEFGGMTRVKLQMFPLPSLHGEDSSPTIIPELSQAQSSMVDSVVSYRELSSVSTTSVGAPPGLDEFTGSSSMVSAGAHCDEPPHGHATNLHHQPPHKVDTDVRVAELSVLEINMMSLEKDLTVVCVARASACYEYAQEEEEPVAESRPPTVPNMTDSPIEKSKSPKGLRKRLQGKVRLNRSTSSSFDLGYSPGRERTSSLSRTDTNNSGRDRTFSSGNGSNDSRPSTPEVAAVSIAMQKVVSESIADTDSSNFNDGETSGHQMSNGDTISPMQHLNRATLRHNPMASPGSIGSRGTPKRTASMR